MLTHTSLRQNGKELKWSDGYFQRKEPTHLSKTKRAREGRLMVTVTFRQINTTSVALPWWKSPNMAIQANTVNFGDSCKGHPKKLTAYYKCIRNDPKNNILNYLTTKDNKSTHSTVILENQ